MLNFSDLPCFRMTTAVRFLTGYLQLCPAMGRGINSRNRVWNWVGKLDRLAGWYDNPMPTWFLTPIVGLKLPTLVYLTFKNFNIFTVCTSGLSCDLPVSVSTDSRTIWPRRRGAVLTSDYSQVITVTTSFVKLVKMTPRNRTHFASLPLRKVRNQNS